ncbi:BlaI/MecI/CopY family transcriptional regulator [Sphingobium nicotianae]|uniref:BlaI/MecI/CopY family transcriptional regulator n=1 Tax=Sphingobium nicotianae TaxID=2782607 RepID=A0A9X1D9A9_9SPHN|nr:BlaI/MecI/CopY family transcriptional regulator [Sphingobium nicotianae]MBT2185523.1 BlaI/MecI/CopY family transcriptional regulator [Sphingobium nicotianae]
MAERISDAEHAVMEVLWRRAPLTATEVSNALSGDRDWSLQTVKTLLGRLLGKNVIAHEEDGRRYLYRPLVAREEYVAGESQRLVDRLFGGKVTPLVAHLAETQQLSDKDIAEIEALLKALKS